MVKATVCEAGVRFQVDSYIILKKIDIHSSGWLAKTKLLSLLWLVKALNGISES